VRPGFREPRVTWEDPFTGEAFVEHTAERVDVGATVECQTFELLGCDVSGRADRALWTSVANLVVETPAESEVGEVHVFAAVE
jgi:hypothetical protein